MDVGAWLRSLGLGRYEAAFRESELDADVLPELTEFDLEGLGTASVCSRRLRLWDLSGNRCRLRSPRLSGEVPTLPSVVTSR
jgi:hypothetical protein